MSRFYEVDVDVDGKLVATTPFRDSAEYVWQREVLAGSGAVTLTQIDGLGRREVLQRSTAYCNDPSRGHDADAEG